MFSFKKVKQKSCPICKYPSYFFCQKDSLKVFKCISCGFGFTDNLLLKTNDYHRDDTYIEEEKLFKNIFQKRADVISKISRPGKVLEVGCSTGILLSLLKEKGWRVMGIEVSKNAAGVARERGTDIILLPFEKYYSGDKYDLIIFNHTLEHLSDPKSVLRKSKSLLTPKGLIYIDLPNFDSLSAKILRSRWPMLLPNEHLWHFTEKAVNIIFKQLDIKPILVHKASGIWDFGSPLHELWQALSGFKKRFIVDVLTLIPSLILTKLNIGSDLLVIGRKK